MIEFPIAEKLRKEQLDPVESARDTMAAGSIAASFLTAPVVQEFFVNRALDCYSGFLKSNVEDLERWQLRAIELNVLYNALTKAITEGDAAHQRLTQLEEERNK